MRWICVIVLIATSATCRADDAEEWKAGVATVAITPRQPMWMAGYAGRTKPSEGVLSELHAKALVIEDSAGTRAVIVTTDLISIPRPLRQQVAKAVSEKYKVDPKGLLLNCSHTHCGPVVKDDLEMSVMYPLDPEQRQRVESYFVSLTDKLVGVIGAAVEDLQPAKLSYSHARCSVAMNRRLPTKDGFQNSPYPDGPVDHDVPVLRIESLDGTVPSSAQSLIETPPFVGVTQQPDAVDLSVVQPGLRGDQYARDISSGLRDDRMTALIEWWSHNVC